MIKLKLMLILIAIASVANGQTKVMDFDIELNSSTGIIGTSNMAQIIPVVNKESSAIFFINKGVIQAFEYDHNHELIAEFSKEMPDGFEKKTKILAHMEESKYLIVFADSKNAKFRILNVDFHTKTVSSNSEDIRFKKESYVSHFIWKKRPFIVTTLKNKSEIIFYEILPSGQLDRNKFDLSDYKVGANYTSLDYFFRTYPITNISSQTEVGFWNAKDRNKLYVADKIIISMDTYKHTTRFFLFDLNELKVDVKIVDKKLLLASNNYDITEKSNSFLFDDYLIQSRMNSKEGIITIKRFSDSEIIKEFNISATEPIDFKNTPIVQEGGGTVYSSERSLEIGKTKKFLKKISNSNLAILANEYKGNKILMSVGSYKELSDNGGGGFGASGLPVSVSVSGSWSKSTYFKSILSSENFEYVEGEVEESVFEKIDKYFEKLDDPTQLSYTVGLEEIYLERDYCILGYYHKKKKKYNLVKFEK